MSVVHLTTHHAALDTRIFQKECVSLAEAGYDVHLIAPGAGNGRSGGITLHALPERRWPTAMGRLFHGWWLAFRAARNVDAKLVHFHDPSLIPVGVALRWLGTTVFYDVHEETSREAMLLFRDRPLSARGRAAAFSLLEALARRTLDGFVCATPSIARSFPSERTVTVRNYPRLERFRERNACAMPQAERRRQFVYAGGLSEARGLAPMLDALDAIPDATLILFGQFDSAESEARARAHPAWPRVDYRGFRPHEEVVGALAESRVGLLLLRPEPAFLEALPIKLFEYMAAGLPVVCSDFPMWREIVGPSDCGLLVDPSDLQELRQALESLLADPQRAERMGAAGNAATRDRYSWSSEQQALLDFYARRS